MTIINNKSAGLFAGVLVSGFLVLIAMMILVEIGAIRVVDSISEASKNLHDHPFTVTKAVLKVDSGIISMHRHMKDVALAKNTEELELAISQVAEKEAETFVYFDLIMERFLGDKTRIERVRQLFIDWKPIRTEVIVLTRLGRNEEAALITKGKGAIYVARLTQEIDGLVEFANYKANEFISKSIEQQHKSKKLLYGLMALVLVIGLFISYFVTRWITKNSEELSKSEEKYRLLNENVEAIPWEYDIQMDRWTYVAPQVQRILGFSPDEFTDLQFWIDHIDIEDRSWVSEYCAKCVNNGESHEFVYRFLKKDGSSFWLRDIIKVEMHNDQPAVMRGLMVDINERKQHEATLQQAQKMEAVGQLTGGIAHDFNNLLSIISGNLRFLRQDIGETSQDIDELFEDAMSATDDGAELTQRLLGFSRARILHPEIKNVNDTIEKSVRFLARTLADHTELETVLPDETLFISVDPSQLENALLNLCINARDAMPEGGTITISAERCRDCAMEGLDLLEGNYVIISVSDTGAGISPEDMQHVYEPFFTTKDVGKGSGLGLSMVYGFTQQSQGACHIDSTLGEGTTVSMYFPEVMDDEVIDKEPEDKKEIASHGSKVILVVEDEPRVRRVALRDLKMLGYKTLEAENADIAKTIIESGEHIDLLFSDVLMPGEMDGHMLAIWAKEHYPQIKIVLTSGYSKGKAEVREDKEHPFPLLRKPYPAKKLAEQIRTMLDE